MTSSLTQAGKSEGRDGGHAASNSCKSPNRSNPACNALRSCVHVNSAAPVIGPKGLSSISLALQLGCPVCDVGSTRKSATTGTGFPVPSAKNPADCKHGAISSAAASTASTICCRFWATTGWCNWSSYWDIAATLPPTRKARTSRSKATVSSHVRTTRLTSNPLFTWSRLCETSCRTRWLVNSKSSASSGVLILSSLAATVWKRSRTSCGVCPGCCPKSAATTSIILFSFSLDIPYGCDVCIGASFGLRGPKRTKKLLPSQDS
mmetsp:Transcript_37536/g.86661  ORF Transcript_37536/g.86661 Transcript_37536/m.86661 type:complete len:263 (-) Transcript_37536:496-1284(-)